MEDTATLQNRALYASSFCVWKLPEFFETNE